MVDQGLNPSISEQGPYLARLTISVFLIHLLNTSHSSLMVKHAVGVAEENCLYLIEVNSGGAQILDRRVPISRYTDHSTPLLTGNLGVHAIDLNKKGRMMLG